MEDYEISIDNYIKSDLSICREERQYALYLSNILRYYGKEKNRKNLSNKEALVNIFTRCGIISKNEKVIPKELIIENVFYEVTFMRDILERNRRIMFAKEPVEDVCLKKDYKLSDYHIKDAEKSFNKKLLEYVYKVTGKKEHIIYKDITEKNYGHNSIPVLDSKTKETLLIRAMMNAKPDLAVIYYDGNDEGIRSLLFLECKFESGEDHYEVKDGNKNDRIKYSQTEIQWHVANFLISCNYLASENRKLQLANIMDNESKKVEFDRGSDSENKIPIADLISLDRTIFE